MTDDGSNFRLFIMWAFIILDFCFISIYHYIVSQFGLTVTWVIVAVFSMVATYLVIERAKFVTSLLVPEVANLQKDIKAWRK